MTRNRLMILTWRKLLRCRDVHVTTSARAPSLAPVSVHFNVVRCHERHVAELASVVCCAAGCTPRRGARAPVRARVRFGVNAAAFVVATCDRDEGGAPHISVG